MGTVTERLTYLQPVVEKLRAALGESLMGVVLYGSHARGEAREDSDVDLLVIARGLPERLPLHQLLMPRLLLEKSKHRASTRPWMWTTPRTHERLDAMGLQWQCGGVDGDRAVGAGQPAPEEYPACGVIQANRLKELPCLPL